MGLKPYCTMMKQASKEHIFKVRKHVVLDAQNKGIKPASRKWNISRNTIRTWVRRFEEGGNKGLQDQRNGPKHIPHKTSLEVTNQVIKARITAPCYGPRRLQYFFELQCSTGAIERILRTNELTRKRRKKYQKKNDLREAKSKWKSGTYVQMDVKYLYDIPQLLGAEKSLKNQPTQIPVHHARCQIWHGVLRLFRRTLRT